MMEPELDSINEYNVFQKGEKGKFDRHKKDINALQDNQKIRVHLMFGPKHSLWPKNSATLFSVTLFCDLHRGT